MQLQQHPEYDLYRQHQDVVARWHDAVAAWRESGAAIPSGFDGPPWTPGRARTFVRSLAHFFHAYNRVLWEQFPYCGQCLGGCCVRGAVKLTPFDAIALALLNHALPALPGHVAATERHCIYLSGQGCAWPAGWRPLKCWSFYCLGSGAWKLDSLEDGYGQLTAALRQVVRERLPRELRPAGDEDPLLDIMADPIGFADALNARLDEAFVAPFAARYLSQDPGVVREWLGRRPGRVDGDVQDFIVEAVEAIYDGLDSRPGVDVAPAQWLADLEVLEWVVSGDPGRGAHALREIYFRYAHALAPQDGAAPSLGYRMRTHVLRLLQRSTID